MASSVTDSNNAELYQALIKKDEQKVLDLCEKYAEEEGPMRVVTIHKDTILHVALYSMQVGLVIKLLENLSPQYIHLMDRKNSGGNTVLHEAATYDKLLDAVEMMLKLRKNLLTITNNNMENPLFRAARYGQKAIFKFLSGCIVKDFDTEELEKYHQKFDGSTVLHAAIAAEHFGL
ncbi:hypothetical protein DCAR_0101183 [Daucus carota subsp. sativus]|uniref:PGG domain-containing protein n=1 Tax=Daucus carota subsp. sativus TaxID=79200 RepID=A0AAF0W2N4_DAUCS|nr:PREDICTED: uncharacterized protein LOC108218507 [Daucus carota subsp. sativus]WOG82024.1 hypothetical protein DCAR_0101183 [Daucus carota subsp. sativus]